MTPNPKNSDASPAADDGLYSDLISISKSTRELYCNNLEFDKYSRNYFK
jgi:hypothetical protein